ncbi:MAG TPA: sigma-54-dependent Fis family transcriptional regulator [Deltaproteobacteria bacterium]|nr:sigma-54-dependent Fis family transcriptional regulator [Deltaproteobacteria bacterium]
MIRTFVERTKNFFAGQKPPERRFSVYTSLFILVPFIFAGIAFLGFLVAYQGRGWPTTGHLSWWWCVAIVLFACLAGIAITMSILAPVRRFVDAVKQSQIFPASDMESTDRALRRGDFHHFDSMFQEVTNLISRVDARERFPDIVGQSAALRGVLSRIIKVAPTDTTVLILGESGVGKELVAEAIYRESERRKMPFVALNCVAIPAGLLESELFGHERGAFTGAQGRKIGKFELADRGTLFLDEIGDMPLETQAKLLRVLQDRRFQRVGGNSTIDVDVRFIAASNKNLERMVGEGTFREDLYYRLNVFTIYIPPLRERVEDVPLLARHMLKNAPGTPEPTPDAMRELVTWHWPGNIRELKNVIERAAVMAEDGVVSSFGLPRKDAPPVMDIAQSNMPPDFPRVEEENGFNLDRHIAEHEKDIIVAALKKTDGVQAAAARLLGISQRSLWHRVKKYGIDAGAFKKKTP